MIAHADSTPSLVGSVDRLWAVTAYFNPMRYRSRLANYLTFRHHLGIPLATIELSHDADFELGERDAEIVIRRQSRAVLWQKERLLNLAVQALPPTCSKVIWIDCDVVFEDERWTDRVADALDRHAIVHPYSTVRRLAAGAMPGDRDNGHVMKIGKSVVWRLLSAEGAVLPSSRQVRRTGLGRGAWGLACAARREVIEEHGLYDACVLGSGDRALLCAALGTFDLARDVIQMNEAFARHYLAWARPFFASVNGDVGCLDDSLDHLWHGQIEHRRYRKRHRDMRRFDFDPECDLALDTNGCWCWNSDKPDLHEFVRDYFRARREDG